METPRELHWHEGQFLQPQHFQLWQRELGKGTALERSWNRPWPYGLNAVEFNVDALGQWRFEVRSLRAVMPSGRVVDWPQNSELSTLDLRPLFPADRDALIVHLAVPLYFPQRRNMLQANRQDAARRLLYQIEEEKVVDENTGEHERSILTRRMNAFLLPETADMSNLETIPIARLTRSASEDDALPKLDPSYMGPLFAYGASAFLRESVTQLSTALGNIRESTAIQLQRSGFKAAELRGSQIEQMMRFRQLNRMHAHVPLVLAQAAMMPAHELYAFLAEAVADFGFLYPERYEELTPPPFNHDDPAPCFQHLIRMLFDLIEGSAESSFIRLPFEKRDSGWFAELKDEHFTRPTSYFLGIRTREDMGKLNELVQDRDRFKLMARTLADRAIFGVRLSATPVPPMQLPAQGGLYYFRLDVAESPRMWERIREEKAMILQWNEWDRSDYEIALYMPLAT